MPRNVLNKPTYFPNGLKTDAPSTINSGDRIQAVKTVTITVVDGAATGSFSMPSGAVVSSYQIDTPVTIPGTPTNTNLRLGSSANGQQYVADVDVKTQGVINATIVYAGRTPATTVYYAVASSGGTAASQDGAVVLRVHYSV